MARLFVCGDIMNMSGNTEFIGQDIGKVINEADYAIANLEGPELFEGQICSSPHQNKGTVKYLKDIGFDLMLLANNHIAELGESGINNTISQINQYNLDYIGVGFSLDEVYKPIIKDTTKEDEEDENNSIDVKSSSDSEMASSDYDIEENSSEK